MAKSKVQNSIESSDQELSEIELSAIEESQEWNEALNRAYETFMFDLKRSTNSVAILSEWFASNTTTTAPATPEANKA
ncbi:MAG: hypothetical protein ACOYD7_06145 [Raoultibacter sp.]